MRTWIFGLGALLALAGGPLAAAASRGADLPYLEYQAEDGRSDGTILGPSRSWGQVAAEASGRRCVQLNAQGQGLTITALRAANSIVVRYCIPDAPDGGGINATLGLWVNGAFVQELNLTSRYSWNYGGWDYPYSKRPSDGHPFHFFDECRALVPGGIPAGAAVCLRVGPADTAAFYDIDLIDLELAAPPLRRPAGFLSIADPPFGAVGDGRHDDGPAIQACLDAAGAKGQGVWIPSGDWFCASGPLKARAARVQGAGMWYATLRGVNARFELGGDHGLFADFAVFGGTTNRYDQLQENAFSNASGEGTVIRNIWVEHTKCGYWVAGKGRVSEGLLITGCRFRDTYADGVNLCAGASHCTVANCQARNTGDDSFASWSPSHAGVNRGNLFSHNTVQSPWRANCFAIYGGDGNAIEDNVGEDSVDYPGILVGDEFSPNKFEGSTRVLRNTLDRCGGFFDGKEQAALKLSAREGDMAGFVVQDLDIVDPTYAGIQFAGKYRIQGAAFSRVRISGAGTRGVEARADAQGSASFSDTTITAARAGAVAGTAAFSLSGL